MLYEWLDFFNSLLENPNVELYFFGVNFKPKDDFRDCFLKCHDVKFRNIYDDPEYPLQRAVLGLCLDCKTWNFLGYGKYKTWNHNSN